jgi:hypothetical protein
MKKRIVLAVMAALLLALMVAPMAQAATPPDQTILSVKNTVWRIWVRGLDNQYRKFTNNKDFANLRKTGGVSYTDAVTQWVYGGVDLKTLVGLVDDKDPSTFNEALATTAPGYLVNICGADGFNYSFPSADVATKQMIVAGAVTFPGATAEIGLPIGTAKVSSKSGLPGFSPAWPLKLVGDGLASGSQKIGGINKISLLPVPVAAK